jgi:hypothetical protein
MSTILFPTTSYEKELLEAAETGDCEKIEECLRYGVNTEISQGMENYTPLLKSATNGHTHAVEILLKHGANIEHFSLFGKTPLMLAAQKGHQKTVAILLRYGANPIAVNEFGDTALTCLSRLGGSPCAQSIEMLLHKNIQERSGNFLANFKNAIRFREINYCEQPFINNENSFFVYTTFVNDSYCMGDIKRFTLRCYQNAFSKQVAYHFSLKLSPEKSKSFNLLLNAKQQKGSKVFESYSQMVLLQTFNRFEASIFLNELKLISPIEYSHIESKVDRLMTIASQYENKNKDTCKHSIQVRVV